MARRKDLQVMAEKFAKLLLSEATGGKIGGALDVAEEPNKIDFKDRRALLDTVTKLIREQNAKEPEDDTSNINAFKEMLNGSEFSGKSGSGRDTPPPPSGDGDASDDDDLLAPGA